MTTAEKRGVCGVETDKQPSITKDGKYSGCGKKLVMEEEKNKK